MLAGSVSRFKVGAVANEAAPAARPQTTRTVLKTTSTSGAAARKAEPDVDGWEEF